MRLCHVPALGTCSLTGDFLVSRNRGSWNTSARHYFSYCRHLPRFRASANFTAGTLTGFRTARVG